MAHHSVRSDYRRVNMAGRFGVGSWTFDSSWGTSSFVLAGRCGRIQIALLAALLLTMILQVGGFNKSLIADDRTMPHEPVLHVPPCDDFQVNGKGNALAWNRAQWVPLERRPDGHHEYEARFKLLYSPQGVYVLFDGTDANLTATMTEDFLDLWNEDVYECFFWTDEEYPIYFEYEISPLGYELPLLIPNLKNRFLGWRPWHYEGQRKVQKEVVVMGGKQESGAKVSGWRAEVFIPYELLKPLGNVPPRPGTQWRANFYRVDHDGGTPTAWDWARVGPSFHDYDHFGTLIFD